jgi:hypothetical protein
VEDAEQVDDGAQAVFGGVVEFAGGGVGAQVEGGVAGMGVVL